MKTLRFLTILGLSLSIIAIAYAATEYLTSTRALPDYEALARSEVVALSQIPQVIED